MHDGPADGFPVPPLDLIVRAGATPGADHVAEYLAGAAGMKDMLLSLLAEHSRAEAPGGRRPDGPPVGLVD